MAPMTLPERLMAALLPTSDGLPLGLHLGAPAPSVAASLPSWFEAKLPDRTGSATSGVPATEDYVPASWVEHASTTQVRWTTAGGEPEHAVAGVALSLDAGQLSRVEVDFDVPTAAELGPAFGELASRFDEQLGLGRRASKKINAGTRLEARWTLDAEPFKSELTLLSEPYFSPLRKLHVHRTTLTLALAEGVTLTAPPSRSWMDGSALARVVASKEWPEARCAEIFDKFFSYDAPWLADKETTTQVTAIYQAARAERGEVRDLLRAALGLADWSFSHTEGGKHDRVRHATWGYLSYSENISGIEEARGLFADLNSRSLIELLDLLGADIAARGAWAYRIVAALALGDGAAFAEVAGAITARRPALPERAFELTFGSPPDIDARAFDLVTSGLDLDDRIRWAARTQHRRMSAAVAATGWLAREKGLPLPSPPLPPSLDAYKQRDFARWASFLLLVKEHSLPVYFDCLDPILDGLHELPVAEALCDLLADEKQGSPAGSALYRIGPFVVSLHTAKGRKSVKRAADEKAAAKELGKKVAAAKRR